MKLSNTAAISIVVAAATTVAAKDVLGVAPDQQHLYKPDSKGNWACLNNPNVVIPFDRVNDDYCDCPDGSDEPGTAACPNGQFYCANKGHLAQYIPSSKVNDGVCDYDVCCDGSDEAGNPYSNCPNKCAEIHAEYERERKERAQLIQQGLKKKAELFDIAEQKRDQVQKDITEQDKKLATLVEELEQHKRDLDIVIQKDREHKLALGISLDQLEMPKEIGEAVNKMKELSSKRKEAVKRVASLRDQYTELSGIMDRLKSGYNPNFNDAAVKEALRSYEDLKKKEEVIGDIQSSSDEMDTIIADLERYRPPNNGGGDGEEGIFSKYLADFRQWLVDNGLAAKSKKSTKASSGVVESPDVVTARQKVENAEKSIEDTKKRISELMDDYKSDYGPNDILRALKDECVSNHVGEYDYTVCFFGSSSQNGNGHNVNLGRYQNFSFENNDVLKIEFDDGTRCWNGPIRKAIVTMTCGVENKILTVSEPEKCEYHFKMVGPAACAGDPASVDDSIVHEDL